MALSSLYQHVGKPLLSMKSVRSIDVECAAKPSNHPIMRKDGNLLSDEKGVLLFRVRQNLRYLMETKMNLTARFIVLLFVMIIVSYGRKRNDVIRWCNPIRSNSKDESDIESVV